MRLKSVLDFFACVFVIGQIVMAVMVLIGRDAVPLHWDISGEIDAVGGAAAVLPLLAFSLGSFIVLKWLERHPEKCNYPRPPRNIRKAYSLMTALVSFVNCCIAAICLFVIYGMYMPSVNINLIWVAILVMVVGCVWYGVEIGKS